MFDFSHLAILLETTAACYLKGAESKQSIALKNVLRISRSMTFFHGKNYARLIIAQEIAAAVDGWDRTVTAFCTRRVGKRKAPLSGGTVYQGAINNLLGAKSGKSRFVFCL
ncbi:hypothetical protein [Caenibacillus caldisaponilyticus]|uniref:hypothetical protein n=1 Tax=Caenibacillus caldisaponilyticus TaxID=1674942 RepID=UPI001178BDA7|nr:hypothetical protein [Caenibacillus caldisaponilyticus]